MSGEACYKVNRQIIKCTEKNGGLLYLVSKTRMVTRIHSNSSGTVSQGLSIYRVPYCREILVSCTINLVEKDGFLVGLNFV